MALDKLVRRAEGLAARVDDDWPFDVAQLGEDLEIELSDPEVFKTVAEEISRLAERGGFGGVIGASRLGERLAGAAVAVASNGLRVASSDWQPERTLIVDGLLATGARLQQVAEALAEGGTTTAAAVVLAIGDTTDLNLRHLEGINVLAIA